MKIGILGATGAVGRQMIICIEEQLPEVTLKLFASKKSEGKTMKYLGKDIVVESVNEHSFDGLDYVLGAVSNQLSKTYLPWILKSKAVYIDNSSAFRMDEDVPLVVPEINGIDALHHKGIIANPNCSTIIACMALYGINHLSKIKKMVVSTYQAVSGAGLAGMQELTNQVQALARQEEVIAQTFMTQIAYNCIPMIGSPTENGYTSEEMKMQNEASKILHLDDLKVSCTCVRVGVYRSHSMSISLETEDMLEINDVKKALQQSDGVVFFEDEIPTPIDASNQDNVYVGRLRKDLVFDGYSLWCCGDQIRKGAASNAVGIIDYLIKHQTM